MNVWRRRSLVGGVMKDVRRKTRGLPSFEERVERLRRPSGSIHSYPGHIFTRIHLSHILPVIGAILIFLTANGVFELYKNYAYYAAIVDAQLGQRLLQRHSGIYAAPRQARIEQRISRDELRERLLRAGYQQERPGTSDDQSSSGSFLLEGDEMKLRTKEFARAGGLPETINIKFDGRREERIVKIEDTATGRDLKSAALPPELLTADGGAGMHTRSHARFDEFP